jgi:DNA-binding protein H-NS
MEMNENNTAVTDNMAEVVRIIETLDYPELLQLRAIIDREYEAKAEAAKANLIAETQRKFEQLGLSFDEVMAMQKKRQRKDKLPAVAKYRSQDGKAWSGRGPIPKWV